MQTGELEARLRPFLEGSILRRGCARLWPESRWQPLPGRGTQTWIKREDELSFGISGSKFRKWLSLAQVLEERRIEQVLAWGSSRSAFLLGLLQVARELGISVELFLLRSTPWQGRGTDQLFRLLAADTVHWIERSDWPSVGQIVGAREAALREAHPARRLLSLAEGGFQVACLPGALTLPLDIALQEERLGITLSSLWVDAGSGFTAAALLCGLGLLERRPEVNVVLCAGSPTEFTAGLAEVEDACRQLLKLPPGRLPLPPFRLHRPATAASFGSTNASVFAEIRRAAENEGLLLDPLYMAKLSLSQRQLASEEPRLLVHSGGALSLFGYEI